MENWRLEALKDSSTNAVSGWTVTWKPEPFVRALADKVLEALCDRAAIAHVSQVVRNTMSGEWDEHLLRDPEAEQKLVDTLKGRDVRKLTRDERRELLLANGFGGDHYARKGWPFPILHGIDSTPGCYLVLAGLNELAAADPEGFDPRHEPIDLLDNSGPGLCFTPYKSGWELVRAENEATLKAVFAAVKVDLESLRPRVEAEARDGVNEVPKCQLLAFRSFEYAQKRAERELKDAEAYDWLKENGIEIGPLDTFGELEGYKVPDEKDTWLTYVSKGRTQLGKNKKHSRAGRAARSAVRPREI